MNTEENHNRRETYKKKKRPPHQKRNPIESAISSWYENYAAHLQEQHAVSDLIAQAPKRWTAYGPLVLLPAGSFTSAAWCEVLKSTAISSRLEANDDDDEENIYEAAKGPTLLWKTILTEISGLGGATKLTHLAINEGIPLLQKQRSKDNNGEIPGDGENILRSPSGLRMLHGDFGPSREKEEEEGGGESTGPTEDDFARAFWVSTKQNGITQTWAPRWTMFSRGNVKEKARLLRFHDPPGKLGENRTTGNGNKGGREENLSHRHIPAPRRRGAIAVDLYAGIGYFAFSYAASGFRKVFCWELNPWSVEGLRRGAMANGWGVRVVRREQEEEEEKMFKDVLAGDEETIVVFLEDNARAADRLRSLDQLLSRERDGGKETSPGSRVSSSIMHVNLGLLPSSQLSWTTAWDIASESRRAWFHIHENVGVADIDAKKGEIREWFADRDGKDGVRTDVCVEHVELVKTFAPGVWHCVFDLCVRRDMGGGVG
ncbi:hypothetical protein F4782DRAFT_538931 [Xylaria castorea]|nr:hypothetical protein F4782DRAFT_538931 [Xylaria castorea]